MALAWALAAACARAPVAPEAAPGPEPVPWEAFAPYLVANVWPHAVTRLDAETFAHVPPAKEDRLAISETGVHYGLCLGEIYRGHGIIAVADDRLLALGCDLAKSAPEVTERVVEFLLQSLKTQPPDPSASVGSHLRRVRAEMVSAVARDPALKAMVCQRAPQRIVGCPTAGASGGTPPAQ